MSKIDLTRPFSSLNVPIEEFFGLTSRIERLNLRKSKISEEINEARKEQEDLPIFSIYNAAEAVEKMITIKSLNG